LQNIKIEAKEGSAMIVEIRVVMIPMLLVKFSLHELELQSVRAKLCDPSFSFFKKEIVALMLK
jgi:hypothetical protein